MEFTVGIPPEKGIGDKFPEQKGAFRAMHKSSISFMKKACKMGKDDPRKIAHALKVGLALCVVSFLYLAEPLFEGVGDSAIWAVMTVVVVFEFTAGATMSKGLNRAFGTLLAAGLALCVGTLADGTGEIGEAIFIGVTVFILGTVATYVRFFPNIKNKYDYGVVIFLLTFNMITVSGYRQEKMYVMAYKRLITIAIGSAICLLISLLIVPIWAGDDLHNSIVNNFECLANSLEECVQEYLQGSDDSSNKKETAELDAVYENHKIILDSKTSEESLAAFACWEPRHGRFRTRHHWKQYVTIGAKLRQCAYSAVALHGCLRSDIQAPEPCIIALFKAECSNISTQVLEVLKELSSSIGSMRRCRSGESLTQQLHLSVEGLMDAFGAWPELFVDSRRWYIREEKPREDQNDEASREFARRSLESDDSLPTYEQDIETEKSPREDEITSRPYKKLLSFDGRNSIAKSNGDISGKLQSVEFAGALGVATFAYLLVELAARVEHVVVSVEELGKLAGFKEAAGNNYHDKHESSGIRCFGWTKS